MDLLSARRVYAGPWRGEFGWELMAWQGGLRKLARAFFDKPFTVVCPDDTRMLYADFCETFVSCDRWPEADSFRSPGAPEWVYPKRRDTLVIPPCWYKPGKQSFIEYGTIQQELRSDLIVHARSRPYADHHNWPVGRWAEFVQRSGRSAVSIGLPAHAHHVPGTIDMRGVPMPMLCDVLRSGTVIAGPTSGPMFLAALCGCPRACWTDIRHSAKGMTNVSRLEKEWNPFGVPVAHMHGWQPTVDQVLRLMGTL